jgi:hypothetical protein
MTLLVLVNRMFLQNNIRTMNTESGSKRNSGNPVDAMLLLAKEAEQIIGAAGASALQKAEEETGKLLAEYEQRAKQIFLKTREEARASAEGMAVRFREALLLGAEEASTAAIDEAARKMSARVDDIVRRMQESIRKEARVALEEGLAAGGLDAPVLGKAVKATVAPPVEPVAEKPKIAAAPKPAEAPASGDFASWLMQ